MGIVIGIDVGISTTKIVGIKNGKVSAPISITAADPITSLFGAFGKYLHDNDIDLKDVEQVMPAYLRTANGKESGVYGRRTWCPFRIEARPYYRCIDGYWYIVC